MGILYDSSVTILQLSNLNTYGPSLPCPDVPACLYTTSSPRRLPRPTRPLSLVPLILGVGTMPELSRIVISLLQTKRAAADQVRSLSCVNDTLLADEISGWFVDREGSVCVQPVRSNSAMDHSSR